MTDITQDPTASLDHWLLKGAHRSPDGTEWYGRHNGEMWVAKVGPPGWRARIVSGAVLNRAGGPTLWRALEILCGLAGWKQPADREDDPTDWDKRRPEVGDHEPEDLVALSDYGWHLDIHDDLVLCPSQAAALRMQSWWDRANAAEAERDRLAANAEAREGLLTRRTNALRAAERRIEALEAAAAPDWRPGVPSVEDVHAHGARSACWLVELADHEEVRPVELKVSGSCVWMRDIREHAPWRKVDDQIVRAVPVGWEWRPAPWPVHAGDSPADGGGAGDDCEGVADAS